MTRKRVNLTLVSSESARKITFKKRKLGLVKKMEEISTLCGINGCMVIFNPEIEDDPLIWPSREKAMELMAKYEKMPKMEQEIKKVDHEKFMSQRVERLREHIAKHEKKNKEAQASILLHHMSNGKKMEDLDFEEVELLHWYSDVKLKEIKRQNLLLPPIRPPTQVASGLAPPSQMTPPLPPPPSTACPSPQVPPPPPPPSTFCPLPQAPPPPPAFCPPPQVPLPPQSFCPQLQMPPLPWTFCPPSQVSQPAPPPPALWPPTYMLQPPPPQVVDQEMFMGSNAQNGGNLEMEPPYQIENDPFLIEMLNHGGVGVGANGMWQGESSNANNLDFANGFEHGFPNSFHGFF